MRSYAISETERKNLVEVLRTRVSELENDNKELSNNNKELRYFKQQMEEIIIKAIQKNSIPHHEVKKAKNG